jgi:ribulose 1,5-bisphosphate synthetase/thiazole synthase
VYFEHDLVPLLFSRVPVAAEFLQELEIIHSVLDHRLVVGQEVVLKSDVRVRALSIGHVIVASHCFNYILNHCQGARSVGVVKKNGDYVLDRLVADLLCGEHAVKF